MKSLKKTLVLLVVFSMILSAVMPAFAATDIYGLDCEEEVARLEALKVVTGYEDGTFGPEKTITRAEMAVILCKMVGIDTVTVEGNANVPSKFSDVKAGEWYTGYVNVAAGKGLLSGFPDGTFRPNEQLTMNQVLTLCVNALGRGEYVSTMGTWPANYIAEATKLGLLDGVKTSDANRGNVAMIVWNTLEAPYVWDVNSTEYEGSINLGNISRSLLSIHFRDYMNIEKDANGKETYAFKEIEYVSVTCVPSMTGTLGEKQIVLEYTESNLSAEEKAFVLGIDTTVPRREDSKEWTTRSGNSITAHAPELEDLNSYYGKVVTVIFGEDNKLVSIRVVDDTVEDQFLTAWEDEKLTIGGTKYKFSKKEDAVITINTVEVDNMADVKTKLSINDMTDITKVIKANVRLDNDGNVVRLDLFVSGNFDDVNTRESIVTKVRNEIITLKNGVEINYGEDGEYEEEDLRPRVMKNNEVIGLEDIAVGDVLTYFVKAVKTDLNAEEITTIYVSSETVEGELTRVSKESDKKLTVNGEKYLASEATILFTDDKISDAKTGVNVTNYIGENITLYLNVYGEYVLIASEEVEEDWTFGILTSVRDTEDDEEDTDIYRIPVRILMADGSTARDYKFLFNDEEDGSLTAWENRVANLVNKVIVFSADANKEIAADDFAAVEIGSAASVKTNTSDAYEAIDADTNDDNDDDRQRIIVGDVAKVFADSTVIFNIGQNTNERIKVVASSPEDGEILRSDLDNTDGNTTLSDEKIAAVEYVMLDENDMYVEYVASYVPETSNNWDLLISGTKLAQDALLIFEEDSKTLSYVIINVPEELYAVSDAEYAIVYEDDYKEKKGSKTKKYVDLLLVDATDAETFETKTLGDDYAKNLEKMFVEFKLSASKLGKAVEVLIDLPAFKKLKATEPVTEEITSATETKFMIAYKDSDYAAATAEDEDALYIIPTGADVIEATDTELKADIANVKAKDYVKYTPAHYTKDDAQADGDLLVVEEDPEDGEIAWNDERLVDVAGDPLYANFAAVGTTKYVTFVPAEYTASDDSDYDYFVIPEGVDTVEVEDLDDSTLEVGEKAVGGYVVALANRELKANFKVVDTQNLLLEYEDDKEVVDYSFGEVIVDEDVIVIDARGGKLVETTFSALRDEVEAEGELYVIPFANEDAKGYLPGISFDINATDANILVIVD